MLFYTCSNILQSSKSYTPSREWWETEKEKNRKRQKNGKTARNNLGHKSVHLAAFQTHSKYFTNELNSKMHFEKHRPNKHFSPCSSICTAKNRLNWAWEKNTRWISYFSCISLICNVIWSLWTRCRVLLTNIANYSENCYYLNFCCHFLLLVWLFVATCCIFIKCFAVYSNKFVFATQASYALLPRVSWMSSNSHRKRTDKVIELVDRAESRKTERKRDDEKWTNATHKKMCSQKNVCYCNT